MSQSSEARWVALGVVGLAAVAGVVSSFQLMEKEDAEAHALVQALAEANTPTPTIAPVPVAPAPAAPTLEIAAATEPTPEPTPARPEPVLAPPPEIYAGVHKLGVNRVTDMARVGTVKFSKRDGNLHLEGRVQRGPHWLSIRGNVEPDGPQQFTLNGTIQGVPDMAWNGETPRERVTEGRFTFRVSKNRPYWRLYEVNGKDCVCWDNCGNDFCYIDIERQPVP